MNEILLETHGLTKQFRRYKAVNDIDMHIRRGAIYGFIGRNGAGKTTTIRMILGIIKRTSGTITWNGKEVTRENVNFGYMPEERGVYPKTKIFDQLMYFARLKGMKVKDATEAIDYWLKRLDMEEYRNMLAEKLSKGNQQKIQFIIAVMNDPELIVLDEPFSGLDPVNTEMLSKVVEELVNKDKYIIMSSHQMSSIEEFCSNLTILNRGNTVLQGNLEEIKESYPSEKIEIISKDNIEDIIKNQGLEILENRENHYLVRIKEQTEGQNLFKKLAENNINLSKFEFKKPTLNEIFIEKVGA